MKNVIARSGTLRIPVPDDEDLIVEYSRPRVTPGMLIELAQLEIGDSFDMKQANLMYEMASMLIVSWNLTDENGPIPTDMESLKTRVDFVVLATIVGRLSNAFKVDPPKGEDSDAG